MNPCDAVLTQQISYDQLDEQSKLAYLSVIDEQTWNSTTNAAGFQGEWMGFLGDFTGDFSYSHFDQARRNYFEKINYTASSSTLAQKLRKYVTDKQVETWLQCMLNQNNFGLFLLEKSVNDDTAQFELMWVHPPLSPDQVPITSSTVTGGRSSDPGVPPNKIFRDSEMMPQGSKSFTIIRDPLRALTVSVDAGGFSRSVSIDSSRFLTLESNVHVLRTELNTAVSSIKALTAELESLKTALMAASQPPVPVANGGLSNTQTALCPPGTYMVGARVQSDPGGDHGQISNIIPIYKSFLPPPVVKQP